MSEGGARFAGRMLTAAATLRTQGRYLLDLLAAALEGHAVTLHPQGRGVNGYGERNVSVLTLLKITRALVCTAQDTFRNAKLSVSFSVS
jgi:hypothetical protein